MKKPLVRKMSWVAGVLTVLALTATLLASGVLAGSKQANGRSDDGQPIQHLVVIFQENVSFDHYFGTYPYATNPNGEPRFVALPGTSSVNGLGTFVNGVPVGALLTNNPNGANPQRLDRTLSQLVTCDMDHAYTDEQKAYDAGLVDQFLKFGAGSSCKDKSIVMDYYDGNTVTALWNYAQYFSMSDNSFSTNFGPSTVGALNLISGQTHGATTPDIPGNVIDGTVIGDPRPVAANDDCTIATAPKAAMSGTNIGDLLNAKNITWGWFQGGFAPSIAATSTSPAVCGSSHQNIAGATVTDYIPHHEPFQYYTSTANPHHLAPTSVAMIGHQGDQANHQYDLTNFWQAADSGHMPAVSFLKAAAYQDGHAGYSDPLDEQTFLVDTINHLQKLQDWKHTAVVIAYDDSDGWYDHVMPTIISQSNTASDALTGPGACGQAAAGAYQGRCGYGPRQPLLVISPWAKANFVDNTLTDQSSILRFIEDNWNTGRIGNQSFDAIAGSLLNMFDFKHGPRDTKLRLDPSTGEVVDHG